MDHDPAIAGLDAHGGQQLPDGARGGRRDAHGQVLVLDRGPDGSEQVELPTDLMADRSERFRVRDPVGQEPIRVLADMREAQRDPRHEAQHRAGQGALAVDGADHRAIEAALPQATGQELDVGRIIVGGSA
jgi:hypothetical protein